MIPDRPRMVARSASAVQRLNLIAPMLAETDRSVAPSSAEPSDAVGGDRDACRARLEVEARGEKKPKGWSWRPFS
jgi:hypothetical protein